MRIERISETMVRVSDKQLTAFVRRRTDGQWEARFEGRWVMAPTREKAITKVQYVMAEINRQSSTSS